VTAFGACAVSLMVVAYALERRHRAFGPLFALGCGLSSAYGFAIGSVPFGVAEALWGLVAVHRHARPAAYAWVPRR
jgi:hypothetical protein